MFFNQNIIWQIVFSILCFFVVVSCHEFTRAAVSIALGDNTPKNEKNLTLNPLKHTEPVGAILFIITSLFGYGAFGWSRTVHTSSLYYKNRKRDTLLVTILPSVANILLAFIALIIWKILPFNNSMIATFLNLLIVYNVSFTVCNCLPVPPMDCVKVLSVILPAKQYFTYMQYEKIIQVLFIFLLLFGLFGSLLNTITFTIIHGMELLLFFL
ncbi:site-2 protease family protein [Lachnospiraceae bacterium 46-61]